MRIGRDKLLAMVLALVMFGTISYTVFRSDPPAEPIGELAAADDEDRGAVDRQPEVL